MKAEMVISPTLWLILGIIAFTVVTVIFMDLFYNVKLGRLFGLYLAGVFKMISPTLGNALILVVNTFIWF